MSVPEIRGAGAAGLLSGTRQDTIEAMFLTLCKGKIHRATVTEANVNYVGSITIDAELLKASGILPHERVQIVNLNNSSRIETYVIQGEAGSGVSVSRAPAITSAG